MQPLRRDGTKTRGDNMTTEKLRKIGKAYYDFQKRKAEDPSLRQCDLPKDEQAKIRSAWNKVKYWQNKSEDSMSLRSKIKVWRKEYKQALREGKPSLSFSP